MNKHLFLEASKKGTELQLTFQQEQQCKAVYKKHADKEGYHFHALWNPNRDYGDEYVILPLRSVYDGTMDYDGGDVFANIIGSTDDERHGVSAWLDLFRDHGIACDSCVTDTYFYTEKPNPETGEMEEVYFTDYRCGGGMVGGHVVGGESACEMPEGASVFLMPICHNHNSCCTDGSGKNGAGFYMHAAASGKAVKLKNYML
jgi:hypothetical protein